VCKGAHLSIGSSGGMGWCLGLGAFERLLLDSGTVKLLESEDSARNPDTLHAGAGDSEYR
jgi:hypothetical protein